MDIVNIFAFGSTSINQGDKLYEPTNLTAQYQCLFLQYRAYNLMLP